MEGEQLKEFNPTQYLGNYITPRTYLATAYL